MKTQYFKFVEKAKKSNLFGIKAGNTRTRRRAFKGNVASFRGFYETQKTSAPNSFLYFFTSTNSAPKKKKKKKSNSRYKIWNFNCTGSNKQYRSTPIIYITVLVINLRLEQ